MSDSVHKWQLLHDYLIDSGLVKTEQLRVHGLTDLVTPGGEGHDGIIGFASSYVCALHISDFAADTTPLKFELARWLGHYQPEQIGKPAFDIRIDPINRETVNLFIELELTEKGNFNTVTGESHLCTQMIELLKPSLDPIVITKKEHVNGIATGDRIEPTADED